MGKKAEQNRISSGQDGVMLEHRAVYDDSLLPSADELGKLKEIDPDIIPWIKKRTEIEQEARVDFNKKRLKLASKETDWSAAITIIALVLATIIILTIFCLSFLLVSKGYEIAGTILGSVDLAALILAFAKIKSSKH